MIVHERPLDQEERQIFAPYFTRSVIESVRIIDGQVPFWLHKRMCAVVLHHRIYLRPGIYQPGTLKGIKLLAHELTHVSQFMHGMNFLQYLWSCRYGYRASHYECEARKKADWVCFCVRQL